MGGKKRDNCQSKQRRMEHASSSDETKLVAVIGSGGIYTSEPSTTAGTAGSISGGQYDAVELQYIGNNTFMVLSNEGYLVVQ